MLRIPYTHSGVLASALAMHKDRAKVVMAAAGVPVPRGVTVHRSKRRKTHVMPPPYVVKPVNEGSSVGVIIVREDREPSAAGAGARGLGLRRHDAGGKLRCGTRTYLRRDGRPPPGRHRHRAGRRGASTTTTQSIAKGGSIHILPAKISPNIYQHVQQLALTAHQALGCRGVSRADFRYDDRPDGTGDLVCLEVNTQPGMTETSLVPELAAHAGLTFGELVRWMVEDASCDR